MRKYWAFYKARIQRTLIYRGNMILFRISSTLLLITLIAVWLASNTNGSIGGYTKDQLITYYLAGSILNSIVFWWSAMNIKEEIKSGEIGAKFLSKPISYYWEKFFEEFGWHSLAPIFAIISVLPVALIVKTNLQIPNINFLVLIMAIFLGSVLFFNMASCLGLLSFWFTETGSMGTLIWSGSFLLGGQAVPLSFFGQYRKLIDLLPFRYVYSFPLEIFLGRTDGLFQGFGVQIFWLIIFGLLFKVLWIKGVKRYSAFGG